MGGDSLERYMENIPPEIEEKISRREFTQRELYRFCLATILISGFLILICIAMIGGYADPNILAGIFSGWIAAVIGFYFIQQGAERAQEQAAQATRTTTRLQEEAQSTRAIGMSEVDELRDVARKEIERLTKQIEERDGFIGQLLEIIEKMPVES